MEFNIFKEIVAKLLAPSKAHGILLDHFQTAFKTQQNHDIPLFGFPSVLILFKNMLTDIVIIVSDFFSFDSLLKIF